MLNGNSRLVIIKDAVTIGGQSPNVTQSQEPDKKTMFKSMYNNQTITESDSLQKNGLSKK